MRIQMSFAMCCLGCALVVGTGCSPGAYNGGGWIRSAQLDEESEEPNDGIATFGIHGKGEDTDGDGEVDKIKGQLQYNDHGNKIAVHGVIDDGGYPGYRIWNICAGGECYGGEVDEDGNEILSEGVFVLGGTYTPVPKSAGEGGTFEVGMIDWGQEGPDEGDYLEISFIGGVYDGYTNSGFLKGGNFSAREAKK